MTITARKKFDPMKASGYFQKEVNFLKDNGFKFIKDGEFWKAVKQ